MKLSAKTEYACLAALELSRAYGSGEPVQTARIAEQHGIPPRFLVQILLQLKGSGLVASTRGAAGGYRLTRSPETITLLDVVSVMDGDERPNSNCHTETDLVAQLQRVQHELCEAQRQRLQSITLRELVDQATVHSEPMWYI